MTTAISNDRRINSLIHRKPSVLVRIAIASLEDALQREDFIVNMATFGDTERKGDGEMVCMGCLATCTLQTLAGVRFGLSDIGDTHHRANAAGINADLCSRIEQAVNALRIGITSSLFILCGLYADESRELADIERSCGYGYSKDIFDGPNYGPAEHTNYALGIRRLSDFAEALESKGF